MLQIVCENYDEYTAFMAKKATIDRKLRNFAKLATEIGSIDRKYKYDIRSLLFDYRELSKPFLSKKENRLINKILKILEKKGQEDLVSKHLLLLSSYSKIERKYAK